MAAGNSLDPRINAGQFIFRQNLLNDRSPLTESLLYGTGTGGQGAWDRDASTGGLYWVDVAAQLSELAEEQRSPISRALLQIETTFGLTRRLLAAVCGVTPKTVYNWLDENATPSAHHQQRIFKLREAALNWQREAYPHPKNHLHVLIMRGKTLLELLNEDPVDVQRILFAGQRLKLAELDETAEVIPDPFE